MIRIFSKNMPRSELARDLVRARISGIVDKFSALRDHRITVTLEMENSPTQAGPDSFSASSVVSGRRFRALKLKRPARNF
jgi:hypothetical protein